MLSVFGDSAMCTYYFDVYEVEFRPSRRLYYDGLFNGKPKEVQYEMAYCDKYGPKIAKIIGCYPPEEQLVHRDRVIYIDANNVTSSATHRATYKYISYVEPLSLDQVPTYTYANSSEAEPVPTFTPANSSEAGPVPTFTPANSSEANSNLYFYMESCSDVLIREAALMKRKLEEYVEEDRRGIKYLQNIEKKLQAREKYCPSAAKKMKTEVEWNGKEYGLSVGMNINTEFESNEDIAMPGPSGVTFEPVVEPECVPYQRRRTVVKTSRH